MTMTYICDICGQEHKTQEELEIEAGMKPYEVGNLPTEGSPIRKRKSLKSEEYGDKF